MGIYYKYYRPPTQDIIGKVISDLCLYQEEALETAYDYLPPIINYHNKSNLANYIVSECFNNLEGRSWVIARRARGDMDRRNRDMSEEILFMYDELPKKLRIVKSRFAL